MKFQSLVEQFKQKELADSEVEFIGEIPMDAVTPYREAALKNISASLELPGFRKGHVPETMALQKVGELAVLEEAVELLMRDFYPELIIAKKIDAVDRPDIRITKLSPGNPVELHIRTAVYPAITLPKNWKSTGSKIPQELAEPATNKEMEETLTSLQKSRTKEGEAAPELNDEFAKSVGAFQTLEELKAQIKKGIGEEKERRAQNVRRGKIIEELLAQVKMSIPAVFVESELEKIIAQIKDDVTKFQMSFEDYLKRVEKTEEELKNEFREQASKRAKLQLVLNKIAEEEKIPVDEKAAEEEMKHALQHFPEAKPELLRIHIETVLRNEKVLQMLEEGEKK